MQMKSVRARLARLEEEIASFERWQQDSIREHPAKKGPSHDRHDGNVRGMRRARAPAEWRETRIALAATARHSHATAGKPKQSENAATES
jgi:hypothetical protein